MSTLHIDSLVEELTKRLGDLAFYSLGQLTSIGFFGSMPAARKALHDGRLTFYKVSPRRWVVSRQSLIQYLEKNCVQATVQNDVSKG